MRRSVAALFLLVAACHSVAHAADTFHDSIAPLLKSRCVTCHSTKEMQGELDLERFKTLDDVKRHPNVWLKVREQITLGEMPPKEKPQLAATEKESLLKWVDGTLHDIALAQAGDPGPVVIRRLSNMEYAYTLRDLTGVAALDPGREFPIDGAAGEGFTNAGAALVMSPALLTKYLDAAKEVAEHAVLLPDGLRFSAFTTQQDRTDELLRKIREFYARYSTTGGATSVNLQGIKFDTNAGGRLPVERYVAALVKHRDDLRAGSAKLSDVARSAELNEKYLTTLWAALNDRKPAPLLDAVRREFDRAAPDDPATVVRAIESWQRSLWRFASVGHIGKLNGPKAWQEPVTPLATSHEIKHKLQAPAVGANGEAGDVVVYLSIGDAGDGAAGDIAEWSNLRLVGPGRSDLPLRDVRAAVEQFGRRREAIVASAAKCLAAAAEAESAKEPTDVAKLATKHDVEPELLAAWLDYLGLGNSGPAVLGPLLKNKMPRTPDYDFIKGWFGPDALSVVANSSDAAVRIPGNMKPHGFAVHPAPKVAVVAAWRSPVAANLQVSGTMLHAHPECGNGIEWALELRRGRTREKLAGGLSTRDKPITVGPLENVRVAPGDMVAMVVSPRQGNHSCDLTAIDLVLNDGTREWNLAKEVSPDILAGNPHADGFGHKDVWHFAGEPIDDTSGPVVPADSLMAKWRSTTDKALRHAVATQLQNELQREFAGEAKPVATAGAKPEPLSADRELCRQLLAFNGPLLAPALKNLKPATQGVGKSTYGIDPALFGKLPPAAKGASAVVEPNSLCVAAPQVIEVRLPASLAAGCELVASTRLHASAGGEGSVQMQVLDERPDASAGLVAGKVENAMANGRWSDNNLRTNYGAPVITANSGPARARFEAAFDEFRKLFPIALCYTKIVPVDEVVTLTLFYREDSELARLMLDAEQNAALDRLWGELMYVSEAPLKQVDAFEQLYQFATQDADPTAFEPMRGPINEQARHFRKLVEAAEPGHVRSVLQFAAKAWRRPLTPTEQDELRALYTKLRGQQIAHEAAVRMLIARVLVAPAFLYRGEDATAGVKATPVDNHELATRLSYFLWSSGPDEPLRALAEHGSLTDPDVLAGQARRMLRDDKVRRLALEFGCQWLHIRDLDTLDEKSERHFPTFADVRGDMLEEPVRFFIDFFQADRPVTSLLDADYMFVNGRLAEHYGFPVLTSDWHRMDGVHAAGRGGILGFAATLAKQSGASRTSPILRGNWISEVVLGEKLPKPPKGVPILPEEAPAGLTERQLIERHSSDAKCAACHKRIDPLGFALEGFDAIGRARGYDAAGLKIDMNSKLADGTDIAGIDGLRNYLSTTRRDDFLRQFCRKLLGYALGRGVQLSDQPLIDRMIAELKQNEFRVGMAVELIVRSPQFREVRGRDFVAQE
jgi:hypothetical protein